MKGAESKVKWGGRQWGHPPTGPSPTPRSYATGLQSNNSTKVLFFMFVVVCLVVCCCCLFVFVGVLSWRPPVKTPPCQCVRFTQPTQKSAFTVDVHCVVLHPVAGLHFVDPEAWTIMRGMGAFAVSNNRVNCIEMSIRAYSKVDSKYINPFMLIILSLK